MKQPFKTSIKSDLKAKEIAVKKIKEDYKSDFSKFCILERKEARGVEASFWNVWMGKGAEDKQLKNGSFVLQEDILKMLPSDSQSFRFELRDRDRIEKFFNSKGYKLVLRIIEDDNGEFWVGKPSASLSVLPGIRA